MKTPLITAVLTGTLITLGVTQNPALALYDGSLNSHPDAQGWSYLPRNPFANPPTASATRTLAPGGTQLNTTSDDRIQSGYSYGPISGATGLTLDRTTGYTLRFDLQVLAEDHSNPNASNNPDVDAIADRAGVSIIALSSDGLGIELGFWTDRIWAQNDGAVKADPTSAPSGTRFTQGEGVIFNTQAAVTQYNLSVVGSTYTLYNGTNPLLAGNLRNYTVEGTPYNRPNFVYIGDNTTSARGAFQLNQVVFSNTPTAVPFAFNPLFGVGLFGLSRLRKAVKARQSAN